MFKTLAIWERVGSNCREEGGQRDQNEEKHCRLIAEETTHSFPERSARPFLCGGRIGGGGKPVDGFG
jgi:hypothetical protein